MRRDEELMFEEAVGSYIVNDQFTYETTRYVYKR